MLYLIEIFYISRPAAMLMLLIVNNIDYVILNMLNEFFAFCMYSYNTFALHKRYRGMSIITVSFHQLTRVQFALLMSFYKIDVFYYH